MLEIDTTGAPGRRASSGGRLTARRSLRLRKETATLTAHRITRVSKETPAGNKETGNATGPAGPIANL